MIEIKRMIQCSCVMMLALFLASDRAFGSTDATIAPTGTAPVYCVSLASTPPGRTTCFGSYAKVLPGTLYYDRRYRPSDWQVCNMGTVPPTCYLGSTKYPMAGKPIKTSYISDIVKELNAKINAFNLNTLMQYYTAPGYPNSSFINDVENQKPLQASHINILRRKVRGVYAMLGRAPMADNSVWSNNGAFPDLQSGQAISGRVLEDLEEAICRLI